MLCTHLVWARAIEEKPFWKAKPAVYRKIIEDRAIIVSVMHKTPSQKTADYKLSLKSAGLVDAPTEFSKRKMLKFEDLVKISKQIREVKYDTKTGILFFHGEAMSYHAIMWIKLDIIDNKEGFAINWKVIRGHLLGMSGAIVLEDYKRRKSEVSLIADYKAKKLPLPATLLDFGLEIVLQQVAKNIRTFLEAEYQRELMANERSKSAHK